MMFFSSFSLSSANWNGLLRSYVTFLLVLCFNSPCWYWKWHLYLSNLVTSCQSFPVISSFPRDLFPLDFSVIIFFLTAARDLPILIFYLLWDGKYLGCYRVFVLQCFSFFRKFLKLHCTLVHRFVSIFFSRSFFISFCSSPCLVRICHQKV